MTDILAINYENEEPLVSARELHEKLNIGTRFNDWFPRMVEYGFAEGTDFYSKMSNTENVGRPATDYNISVDMAKQICMIQRTPEGKQCRQYLIDLEKAWNTPEQVMARALQIAERTIESIKTQNAALLEDVNRMKPKEVFADAVSASNTTILIGDLAKLICQNGVEIGQRRMFEWLREKGYLIKRNGSDWNMPTQKSLDLGLFKVKESTTYNPDGSVRINRTTTVTGKGQQYFINKFIGTERSA